MNESAVEVRIQGAVDSVVQQPIAYIGLVNVAGLGVADAKVVVGGMGVGFGCKVVVEGKEILF